MASQNTTDPTRVSAVGATHINQCRDFDSQPSGPVDLQINTKRSKEINNKLQFCCYSGIQLLSPNVTSATGTTKFR